jgi:hypothetical protein
MNLQRNAAAGAPKTRRRYIFCLDNNYMALRDTDGNNKCMVARDEARAYSEGGNERGKHAEQSAAW